MSTMSATKRLSLVRQFSLQCETSKTQQQRRQSLKKQASEELPEAYIQPEVSMRISFSAKTRAKITDRPPPAKLAWTEKPSPPKNSTAKESILNNVSQDLTDRLRQAWKEKEQSKQNIDIFLTPNQEEDVGDPIETDRTVKAQKLEEPKIILPLKPEVSNENVKNVFQKRIRKTMKQKSLFSDSLCYSPTTTKCSTIVVPVIDRKSITPPPSQTKRILSRQNTMEKEQDKAEEILAKQVVSNVIIRPSTAASKRDMFQKRTNSAFQGSVKKDGGSFRPPLVRASSVPSKPEQKQPKFLASNKRTRAKTAKAKLKSDASEDESDLLSGGRGGGRRMQRCVSVNGEVETMISLISPSGSDNEAEEEQEQKTNEGEEEEGDKEKVKAKLDEKLEGYREQQKNFSLRKTVKSVSFQQSSIHAVRSFSASFPARRCSVATALMLGGNKTTPGKANTDGGGQKIQEKRAPVNVLEDGQSVPKRRLVRTKSAPLQQQQSVDDANEASPTENKSDPNKEEISVPIQSKTAPKESPPEEKDGADETQPQGEEDDAPKFENPKEKQCWELYRKMSAKGVAISFDTILRGMLTPTEYRLRRKPSLVPEDNCEITTGN